MPEHLTFKQCFGDRAYVDTYEHFVGSARVIMNGLDYQILSGAVLTNDKNIGLCSGYLVHQPENLLH